jgi:HlyD family secretion protein
MIADLSYQIAIKQLVKDLNKTSMARKLTGLLTLSLLIGSGYVVYHQNLAISQREAVKRNNQTVAVERVNLAVTVAANGNVQAERSINVSLKTSGKLRSLQVKEGDKVKQGQILAYMDDSNLKGELAQAQGKFAEAQANLQKLIAGNRSQEIAQAQAQFEEAQANLQKLVTGNRPQEIAQTQARLRNAQTTLHQAEDNLRRNQRLATAGAISTQDLNAARTNRDNAQANVSEAQQALSLSQAGTRTEEIAQARAQVKQKQQALSLSQAGTRIEEITQARAQVLSAQGGLQSIQAQLNDTIIRAPFDGVVTKKYADPGAFVAPTTAGSAVSSATSSSILSLAASNQIVADVAETNIAQIQLGQELTIKADAYPGKTFSSRVAQIAAQSTIEQNVTSFEVKSAVLTNSQQLRVGMNVDIEFQVGQIKNALVVPTVAIARQEKATGVFVAGDGENRSVFTPIVTGVTVNEKTEVKSGLTGMERVLITFPEKTPPSNKGIFPPA